ncbi:FAD/NAD(P)-binding oxidoreductase [Nocardioides endophyticus]|uniref:FAD/NAD(P)-binding oxidoreductase n=1 Tax=Nocardioides endophyticus TaxID=1353775 RepID=A0ABP8ZCX8_9ACTN
MTGGVVVVGASLAGLRVSEALRRLGYDGPLRLVGEEEHLPYDRPPLSKQVLTGDWEVERVALTSAEALAEARIETLLGSRAVAATDSTVTLADDRELNYDHLVVATGASARRWPGAASGGRVHPLRTLDDSVRLRAVLETGGRVVVVGGGFIGLEVAAAARHHGREVTVVEVAAEPLAPVLGVEIGGFFRRLHEAEGVRVRTGTAITRLEELEQLVTVHLADGTELHADHVVVGIGAAPNNAWLVGLGLADGGGVPCDHQGRALDNVWAVGDVAAWHEPAFGDRARHEHWTSAVDQAAVTAAAILGLEPSRPHEPPYFWSTQFDVNFQLVGRPDLATAVTVLERGETDGVPTDRGTVFGFHRADRLVAVATFHSPRRFLKLRRELQLELAAAIANA